MFGITTVFTGCSMLQALQTKGTTVPEALDDTDIKMYMIYMYICIMHVLSEWVDKIPLEAQDRFCDHRRLSGMPSGTLLSKCSRTCAFSVGMCYQNLIYIYNSVHGTIKYVPSKILDSSGMCDRTHPLLDYKNSSGKNNLSWKSQWFVRQCIAFSKKAATSAPNFLGSSTDRLISLVSIVGFCHGVFKPRSVSSFPISMILHLKMTHIFATEVTPGPWGYYGSVLIHLAPT